MKLEVARGPNNRSMSGQQRCEFCDDTGWVCENHPDRPWRGFTSRIDACECGAGAPCDACNRGDSPDISRAGMKVRTDKDGSRH
jgi:hypothetical protein